MALSKDFIWGVSCSAYQVEGGANENGKGEGIWDKASHTAGKILNGHTGDVACDHYHRFKEDVSLMKSLGVKNYRFSISWTRLIPNGTGEINSDGVRFYTELVDELLKNDIRPWPTLFHWNLPVKLYYQGGFLNPKISDWFADYAEVVAKMFGEKVNDYIIMNEPQCFAEDGHFTGCHAPFLQLSREETFIVAHNLLLSIGKAEKKLRKSCNHKLNIGFAPCFTPSLPGKGVDVETCREHTFMPDEVNGFYDGCFFTDALIFGKFSKENAEWGEKYNYFPSEEDMKIIKSEFDFFGLNIYRGFNIEEVNGEYKRVKLPPNAMLSDMGWQITPEAIYYAAKFYYERYKLPLLFTENGIAVSEWKTLNGTIPDYMRIDFMKRNILEMKKAAEEYPILGYFYWSFMDNFEWTSGYSKRFGLVHTDYDTLERTPKESAYWYKKVMETNGEDLSVDK